MRNKSLPESSCSDPSVELWVLVSPTFIGDSVVRLEWAAGDIVSVDFRGEQDLLGDLLGDALGDDLLGDALGDDLLGDALGDDLLGDLLGEILGEVGGEKVSGLIETAIFASSRSSISVIVIFSRVISRVVSRVE